MLEPARARIVADVHERQSRIPDLLEELGASVEIAPLPGGDYRVGSDTVVERKRVRDLHAAIMKGHFWPQLAKLRAAAEFPYLLVEGTDLDRGPLSPNSIRGACLAAIDQGIALLQSDHQVDSARWLHRLAIRCQREDRPPDRPAYSQRPPARATIDAAEALLAAVPGISTGSARALLTQFGSVAAVLAATPEEWLKVPGIGPERARALRETLTISFSRPPGREKPGPST